MQRTAGKEFLISFPYSRGLGFPQQNSNPAFKSMTPNASGHVESKMNRQSTPVHPPFLPTGRQLLEWGGGHRIPPLAACLHLHSRKEQPSGLTSSFEERRRSSTRTLRSLPGKEQASPCLVLLATLPNPRILCRRRNAPCKLGRAFGKFSVRKGKGELTDKAIRDTEDLGTVFSRAAQESGVNYGCCFPWPTNERCALLLGLS